MLSLPMPQLPVPANPLYVPLLLRASSLYSKRWRLNSLSSPSFWTMAVSSVLLKAVPGRPSP